MNTPRGDNGGGDFDASETSRQLAWSQEETNTGAPLSYPLPPVPQPPADLDYPAEPEPLVWYKRPVVLFGVAAALALAATGGLAYTLTGSGHRTGDSTGVTTPGEPAGSMTEATTVTVTAPDGSTSLSTIPPTSAASTPATTSATTTPTTSTTPSTTTTPTTTTSTTRSTTTTPSATSTAPSATSTAAPSTTAAPPATTAPAAPTGSR